MMGFKRLGEIEAAIARRKASPKPVAADQSGADGGRGVRKASGSQAAILFRRFIVRKNERGLRFKNGDFIEFLEPGEYRYFDPLRRIEVHCYDLARPMFEHPLVDYFIKRYPEFTERYCRIVELDADHGALVYQNGRLATILPPASRTVYWQGLVDIEARIIDLADAFAIPRELAAVLVHAADEEVSRAVKQAVFSIEVPEYHLGLLNVDGKYVETLEPGLHAYWQFNHHLAVELIDGRLQEIEVSGQEILTKDKVGLRINLAASFLLADALRARAVLVRPVDFIYRELQFGLRAAVGTRTLDELLENKSLIDELVFAHIREKTGELGIEVRAVGVKDIILPGDMKTILARVVEAEKTAQANLIRRREETAATRSLLNTARVMEDNPTALRLKELETLEKLTEKVERISVYGGLDSLLKELVKLKP